MKITAIITEYNPFHLGHKYQIDSLKKKIDTFVVVIMSGNFVQRGEISILDKYQRAKIAVKNGVDLVIELPFYFSLQSAENFSKGAIQILNSLNTVDNLCFGYECENYKDLIYISNFQLNNKEKINFLINKKMKQGFSYAVAFKDACLEINKESNVRKIKEDFFISNNILAIEYIKNLYLTKSKIKPLAIKRVGENYNSENYHSNFQLSATSIRKAIYENNLKDIKKFVCNETFDALSNNIKNKNLPDEKKIMEILKYNIIQNNIDVENIVNYENGILNLIKKNIFTSSTMQELLDTLQSKRYKKVRIKRFILNYLLNVNKNAKKLFEENFEYIKPLAFNENGRNILKKIKENSNIKIISKSRDIKLLSENGQKKLKLEEKSEKIYKLFTNKTKDDKFKSLLVK